jgi:hypothetical protein
MLDDTRAFSYVRPEIYLGIQAPLTFQLHIQLSKNVLIFRVCRRPVHSYAMRQYHRFSFSIRLHLRGFST